MRETDFLDTPEGGPSHVIVTIRIFGAFEGEPKTVYWYHVPRVGDRIEVSLDEGVVFQGPVEEVIWTDSHVQVWLAGK